MRSHTSLICWLLAWGKLLQAEDARLNHDLSNYARHFRVSAHFTAASKAHRLACSDWHNCPVRRAGGSHHWAGLI